MFRCAFDGKVIGPGVKSNKVVVETRKKNYTYQKKRKLLLDEDEGKDTEYRHPAHAEYAQSQGFEIVREVTACDGCAKVFSFFDELEHPYKVLTI